MQAEDIRFMSELDAAIHLKPRMASTLLLFSVLGLFVLSIVWMAAAKVEERSRGSGQIIPSSEIQLVQSLEGGILSELHVHEGDLVQQGQILARIDDVRFASESRGMEVQMTGLRARQARLTAEAEGKDSFQMPQDIESSAPDIARNEVSLFQSRLKELNTAIGIIRDEVREMEANIDEVGSSIAKFEKTKALMQDELAITRKLVEKKAVPEIEKIRLEREYAEVSGDLETARKSKISLEAKLQAAQKREQERRSAYRSQALTELNEVEGKIAGIREGLKSADDRVRRTELKAPVEGIVKNIAVKTIGGVVEPAQRLIEIVPVKDDLLIRARIRPQDVAFLKPGQDVRVSITAYDPQIYGYLKGKLERIGADSITDGENNVFFEIDVRTDKNHLGGDDNPLRITPGMVAETEVITGRKSILSYLLKPVLRIKNRAFSEK